MKRIKAISMMLAFVMIFMSCNFGMMFTSNAADINTADDWNDLVITDGMTIDILSNIDFDGATLEPKDLSGKSVTINGNRKVLSNFKVVGNGLFTSVGKEGTASTITSLGIRDAYVYGGSADTKGYGILAGEAVNVNVTGCFTFGTLAAYNDSARDIGGMFGSFSGTVTESFSSADILTDGSCVGGLVGRYTGTENASAITYSYSTGTIDNSTATGTPVYDYIGGLIGYSKVSCVSNCYTATFIQNAYADTVKAIGCIKDLEPSVYYDETISFQRQCDLDTVHRSEPGDIYSKLNNSTKWTYTDGYYPQISAFFKSGTGFSNAAYSSTARVDLAQHSSAAGFNLLYGTGREFTVMSSETVYNYAMLTNTEGVTWRINGGVDEYYFHPGSPEDLPTSDGSMPDGLSGNVLDTHSGKYLFTRTGDVIFTARAGKFERNIKVHVTTDAETGNPYIFGGTGSASAPYLVSNEHELDMVRMYCINETDGNYNYKLDADITLTNPFNPIVGFKGSLNGNSKTLKGINVTTAYDEGCGFIANITAPAAISSLTVTTPTIAPVYRKGMTEDPVSVGFIGEILAPATFTSFNVNDGTTITLSVEASNVGFIGRTTQDLTGLYLPLVNITALSEVANAGTAVGLLENAKLENTLASGSIMTSDDGVITNSGMLVGAAVGTIDDPCVISVCSTMGRSYSSQVGGGVVGTADVNTSVIDCYSTAVVFDAITCSGIVGSGDASVTNSMFTGMLAPGYNGYKYGITSGKGTITNSYFDEESTAIFDQANGKSTLELCSTSSLMGTNWTIGSVSSETPTKYQTLTYFASSDTTEIKRAHIMSAEPVIYSYASGGASSMAFDSAIIDGKNYEGSADFNKPASVTGEGNYTVSGSSNKYTIKNTNGGNELFRVYDEGVMADIRYLYFDDNTASIYYKFVLPNGTEYSTDMSNRGLVDVSTNYNMEYGAVLDSSVETYTEFLSLGPYFDSLTVGLSVPVKYSYELKVYADDSKTELTVTDGTFSAAKASDIYIDIIIEDNTLPWGIYQIDCD